MYSTYLKQDVGFRVEYATGTGGKKHPIVYHSDLEHFIVDMARGQIHYDYPFISPGLTDAVVTCAMWDASCARIVAVGEATADTLPSGVSRSYPTTTAANRAFDRAAIRFLGLEEEGFGQVYSNLEMAPDGPKNYDSKNLADAPENFVPVSEPEQQSTTQEEAPVQAPVASEPPVAAEENVACNTVANDDGNVIISIGKYAGKNKTIAEVYRDDQSWLQYVVNSIHPKKQEFLDQIERAKKYIAAQEGK